MPLLSALRRQRQAELYEFKANLIYKASSRTARADIQRNKHLQLYSEFESSLHYTGPYVK